MQPLKIWRSFYWGIWQTSLYYCLNTEMVSHLKSFYLRTKLSILYIQYLTRSRCIRGTSSWLGMNTVHVTRALGSGWMQLKNLQCRSINPGFLAKEPTSGDAQTQLVRKFLCDIMMLTSCVIVRKKHWQHVSNHRITTVIQDWEVSGEQWAVLWRYVIFLIWYIFYLW